MPKGTPSGRRRRGGRKLAIGHSYDKSTAQRLALEYLATGMTVRAACEKVGRSIKAWEQWRRESRDDPHGFKARADAIMSTRKVADGDRDANRAQAKAMGFEAFRKRYLGVGTFWHQQQWIDMIEGRPPRDLHPAQTYVPGRRGRLLINTPPNHAKTTTLTVDYPVYRICCDPNVKIALVSETEGMAKKFLADIKDRLTQPQYADLIRDFAPEGGFQQTADIWGQTQIKLAAAERTRSQKDPTVEALGIGSQIYGARLDLIFLDDAIGTGNVNQWRQQLDWFRRMVVNRPGPGGRIIVVGTRIATFDLYGQFMDPLNYGGRPSPWSYLAQPAILEEPTEDNPQGRTLWPYADSPWVENSELDECEYCDGYCAEPVQVDGRDLFPRWDMTHLVNGPRADTGDERSWQMIYQQRAVPEDSTFPEYAVNGAVNGRRNSGVNGGLDRVPTDGNVYWIGSCDPATTGHAGLLVYAIDRRSKKRYVVDVANLKGPTPGQLKEHIKRWSTIYPIKEWRVEKTGLNTMFTQDADLRSWLSGRGIVFRPHYTGSSKWDADYGVASMSGLFGSWDRDAEGEYKPIHDPIIELPRLDTSALRELARQLTIWSPELDPKKVPCDLVMALWFAEVAARDIVKSSDRTAPKFQKSRWLSGRKRAMQTVVNLSDYQTVS